MRSQGGAQGAHHILGRAAAQVLLRANAIRVDVLSDPACRLDTNRLHSSPDFSRFMTLVADALYPLGASTLVPASLLDTPLAQALGPLLSHKPGASNPLGIAYESRSLNASGGFAILDNGGPHPYTALVTYPDILEVMHLSGLGETRARFAMATLLRVG